MFWEPEHKRESQHKWKSENPEGWDGEGGGRRDRDGEHTWIHGWLMSIYGKNHYNIVK